MWKIHRRTPQLIVASVVTLTTIGSALAEDSTNNSFQLPGVSLPSGSDEVRAADGTSCRSAVGNGGAYLDIGVIGNPSALTGSSSGSTTTDTGTTSAYGRIVIPLGRSRKRVDCTRLYDLEVRRLEMELRLMEMGLGRPIAGAVASSDESISTDDEFSDDEWSNDGLSEN
jgi:hypothetical protein